MIISRSIHVAANASLLFLPDRSFNCPKTIRPGQAGRGKSHLWEAQLYRERRWRVDFFLPWMKGWWEGMLPFSSSLCEVQTDHFLFVNRPVIPSTDRYPKHRHSLGRLGKQPILGKESFFQLAKNIAHPLESVDPTNCVWKCIWFLFCSVPIPTKIIEELYYWSLMTNFLLWHRTLD